MRRFFAIFIWVLAIGLLVAGGWFLLKATRGEGWSAAAPAVSGLGCVVFAAALLGRHVAGWVAFPVTSLAGHLFYPQSRFTRPPNPVVAALRARIAEGKLRSAGQQIHGLLKAYPRDARLYHAWALLEKARGRSVDDVTAEASRALSTASFAEYEALLHGAQPLRMRR